MAPSPLVAVTVRSKTLLLLLLLVCCLSTASADTAGRSSRKLQQTGAGTANPAAASTSPTTTAAPAGGGRGDTSASTTSAPRGIQPGTFQEFMRLFLAQVGAPDFFFDHFVFSRFGSAFVFTEEIGIQEAAVSLGETIDAETGFLTYAPKQFWADSAYGALQDFGVSALFIANDAGLLGEGVTPQLGNQFSVGIVRGIVNVPARRRRILAKDYAVGLEHAKEEARRRRAARRRLAQEAGGGEAAEEDAQAGAAGGDAAAAAAAEQEPVVFEKTVPVTPAQVVALSRLGFFDHFAKSLPPHLRANLTALLERNLRPAAEYMRAANVTEEDVAAAGGPPPPASAGDGSAQPHLEGAAAAAYGAGARPKSARRRAEEDAVNWWTGQQRIPEGAATGTGGSTVSAFSYPTLSTFSAIPFLDIEFNINIVLQPNVIGTGLSITPLAWRLGANGFVAQSFKVAPLLVGFQQSTVQTLLQKAANNVNGTAQLLRGNAEGAADAASTFVKETWTSVEPLPAVAVVSFDVFFREQLQINGGDIANIL